MIENIKDKTEKQAEKIVLKNVYTFLFGRNVYTVRMGDIKKITLLGHNFIEKKDDKEEVTKTLYVFSVVGNQINGVSEQDNNGHDRPMYETIMEVKAEENDYPSLYTIYEDLVIKWDAYLETVNKTSSIQR